MAQTKSIKHRNKFNTDSSVFMIISKNEYEKNKLVNEIIKKHFDKYNVDNLTLDEDVSYIDSIFRTKSLINASKVIFIDYNVKSLGKKFIITKPRKKSITYEEHLIELISNLADNILVFLFPDSSDKRKSLQKLIIDKFSYKEISEPTDESLKEFINSYSKECHVKLDNAIVKYILKNVAKDIGVIQTELDKLFLYACLSDLNKLSLDSNIEDIIVISSEVAVFDIIDAIAKKDIKTAFTLVDGYMAMNNNIFSFIALLQRNFRLLYYAGVYKDSFGKTLHVSPYVAKKYIDRIRLFSEREIVKKLMFLLNCECDLKSGLNPDNAVYDIVLELLN